MSKVILKTGISILDKFNYLRNNKSYAHDNYVLNNDESMFIYNTIVNSWFIGRKYDITKSIL